MKIYDIIIIGSGPSAYGILSGIPNNQYIAVISNTNQNEYNKDTLGDQTHINNFGGGLDMWHGVSSFELFNKIKPQNIKHAIDFFKKEYDECSNYSESFINNRVYIPNKKINIGSLKKLIEKKKCDLIVDSVKILEEQNNYIKIISENTNYYAKKVCLCAGAIGTSKIAQNSGFGKRNKYISNHINGYAKLNRKITTENLITTQAKNGHFKKYITGKIKNDCFMMMDRPSLFDFKNSATLQKYKTIYSRDKASIFSKILKSLSPGLVMEAVYNRYGYSFKKGLVNRYFQIECNNIYSIDKNETIKINNNNLNNFVSNLKLNNQFSDASLKTIVSGIHFYNSLSSIDNNVGTTLSADPTSVQKSILIADSSNIKSIGGSHHTFSIMALNNLVMRSIYE